MSARQGQIDTGYDVPKISRHLDMINIMAYDYHGVWENKTGHNAPLGPRPDEGNSDKELNVVSCVCMCMCVSMQSANVNIVVCCLIMSTLSLSLSLSLLTHEWYHSIAFLSLATV